MPRQATVRLLLLSLLTLCAAPLVLGHHPTDIMHGRERVIRHVPVRERVVALTFDDGPHPVYTPQILALLDRYGAKSTFFMIGDRMERYPHIVRLVAADGQVIANHTQTHPQNLGKVPRAQIISELNQCDAVIERLTGQHTHLFRPPRGKMNSEVDEVVAARHDRIVLWTVSADHHEAHTPAAMAQRALRRVQPGAIILLHDGRFNSRWRDVAATEIILRELTARGYRCVTLPELLAMEQPHVRFRHHREKSTSMP